MYTLIVILHLFVCFLMIASILLQAGKGAEIGAAFGGSSQTVFGSRGPGTFLSKVTVAAALIFMLTSLGLAVLSRNQGVSSSVIEIPETSSSRSTSSSDTGPPSSSTTSETSHSESGHSDSTHSEPAPASTESTEPATTEP